ncbi:hypothetical protein C8J56DRAFT_891793 [Mycena floridula]|nr:hypothetical protein C8J56DRAFT_891793 [Mycena floridula]
MPFNISHSSNLTFRHSLQLDLWLKEVRKGDRPLANQPCSTTYEELTVSDKEVIPVFLKPHGIHDIFQLLKGTKQWAPINSISTNESLTHAEVADALFLNLGSKGVPSLQQTDSSAVSKAQMAIHCLLNHLRGEGINVDALVPVLQCSFGGVIAWLDFFLICVAELQDVFGSDEKDHPLRIRVIYEAVLLSPNGSHHIRIDANRCLFKYITDGLLEVPIAQTVSAAPDPNSINEAESVALRDDSASSTMISDDPSLHCFARSEYLLLPFTPKCAAVRETGISTEAVLRFHALIRSDQFRFTLWRLMNLMTPNNEPVAKKASRGAQGLIDATDLGSKKFAKLIIQKLRSLTPTQTPDIILFLHNFIILLKVPTKDHPFITVCFEEGIIQLIVENLLQMAKQTTSMLNRNSREHESIITSFQFISAHIATGVVVSWIVQAIKSGILSAYLSLYKYLSVDLTGFPECGADFLRATLPKYLTHRPVVKAAMEALATMRADPKMSVMLARIARESSSAADAWGIFEDLVAHQSVQLPMVFVEPAVCGNIQVSSPLLRLIGYQESLTKHSERHCGMDRDDMRARPHKYTITTGLFEIAEGQVRDTVIYSAGHWILDEHFNGRQPIKYEAGLNRPDVMGKFAEIFLESVSGLGGDGPFDEATFEAGIDQIRKKVSDLVFTTKGRSVVLGNV